MSAGTRIQNKVKRGIEKAGRKTGTGPLICTIRRASAELDEPTNPWDEPADPVNAPQLFPVTAIERIQDVRDMTGMLVGMKKRTLTINATGVTPLKSDTIAVGVAPGDVVEGTKFEEIISVMYLSPGGTVLLYRLELAV